MATGQLRPITVTLKYEQVGKKKVVTAEPTIDSLLRAKPKQLKRGKRITFKSPQGDLDLLLEPKPASAFKPVTFQTGDKPVRVTQAPKKVTIWCGGRFLVRNYKPRPNGHSGHGAKAPVIPKEVRITPRRNRLGVHGDDGL
jgi:hypothetical protein